MQLHHWLKLGVILSGVFIGVGVGKDLAQTLINKMTVATSSSTTG